MVWGAIAAMAAKRFAPQLAAGAAEWGAARFAGQKAASWVAGEAGQKVLTKAIGQRGAQFVTTKGGQQLTKRLVRHEVHNVIGPSGRSANKADTTLYEPGTQQTHTGYSYPGPSGRRQAFGAGRQGAYQQGAYQQNWQQQVGDGQRRGGGGGGSGTPVWKRPGMEGLGGVQPGHDWRKLEFGEIQRGRNPMKRPLIAEGKGKDALRAGRAGFMQQYAEGLGTETKTSFAMPMSDIIPKTPAIGTTKIAGELPVAKRIPMPAANQAPGTRTVSSSGEVTEGSMGGSWEMSATERNRRTDFEHGTQTGMNPKKRLALSTELSEVAKL